jgi:2-polyprenyl-3-methyl-5-hydroxy-6-metoxy-1,4-benzoquinol methylase
MTRESIETMTLANIVPEYQSKNPIVQWLFHKRLKTAQAYVRALKPNTLLDAGCGDGSFVRLMAHDSTLPDLAITGFDINTRITSLSAEFPKYSFVVGSMNKTDFADESFDVVVTLDVLEHFEHAHVPISELRRVIKKGGHLITSEPVESVFYKTLRFLIKGTFSEVEGPGSSPHYHNARGIDRIVRECGFARVESKKLPVPMPFDLFHINLYKRVD